MSKRLAPASPRRAALHRAVGCAAAGFALLNSPPAQAVVLNISEADLLAKNMSGEGVRIEFAPLADTGASVPLRAVVNAPKGSLIQEIEVFLPENPNTRALKLRLFEPQATYNFSTRLRLAGSQNAWVVATMVDGRQIGASAHTVITSSACFDGS